jgi:hypothetical protein
VTGCREANRAAEKYAKILAIVVLPAKHANIRET